ADRKPFVTYSETELKGSHLLLCDLDICTLRGCCWSPQNETSIPWCYFSNSHGYQVEGGQTDTETGFETTLTRIPAPSLFGNDIERLVLTAEYQTANRFRFKITDPDNKRYEVPHPNVSPFQGPKATNTNYRVEITENPFSIRVIRMSTNNVLIGPLVYSDQFLQLSIRLPSWNVYGIGEQIHRQYRHDFNWKTWPIFTRDAAPIGEMHNLYGAQTFFLCLEDGSGHSFGVFFMNSNAMGKDYECDYASHRAFDQGASHSPALLYIWKDASDRKGKRRFHVLRWLTRCSLSRWPCDPEVSADSAESGKTGPYGQGYLYLYFFPQHCVIHILYYWTTLLAGAEGSWSSTTFVGQQSFHVSRSPPSALMLQICFIFSALQKVFPGQRSFLLSRSTFAGSGKLTGHWLGDNFATWNDIKWSIQGILEFGLFGYPYIGADICGFAYEVDEELCRRWYQLGAFYPFSRSHNEEIRNVDPAFWGKNSLLMNTTKHYLNIRYTLLPYLYTLFYRAHSRGDTVSRPVQHEFYADPATWAIDRQFLWGPGLLITPVLDAGTDIVTAYMPDAAWYDYETGVVFPLRKQTVQLSLPADKIGLHLRGGYIFPTQQPANTTVYSRSKPMGLIIALDDAGKAIGELFWDDGVTRVVLCCKISVTILYAYLLFFQNVLYMTVAQNGYTDSNTFIIDELRILGLPYNATGVTVTSNGVVQNKNLQVTYSAADKPYIQEGLFSQQPAVEPVPFCYYPSNDGYTVEEIQYTPSGLTVNLGRGNGPVRRPRVSVTPIDTLRLEVKYHENDMLQFKIYDYSNKRYEVPVPLNVPSTPASTYEKRLYDVAVQNNPFGIQIRRRSTGTVIWDSQVPGFIFSDMFIQISTRLPSQYVYGFGETEHAHFRHEMDWHTWGMFARDQSPGYKLNTYGVHPFYMGLENDGNAHGVLLLNSNGMEVKLQPTPALTYRTIGGILDFYVVLGPTPEQVVQEYTALIGRPVMPPYWSLGFQLCRYGYGNDTEISDLYDAMRAAKIPYDVQYADIDYMERQLDFTIGPEFSKLPALVDKMKLDGMRFIIILDPAISGNETKPYPPFTRGVEDDVFIKWPNSSDIVWGKVWPDYPGVVVNTSISWDEQTELYRAYVAFPDFFRNSTVQWWKREIQEFHTNPTNPANSIKFDGIWIDMNEPANFVNGAVGGCGNSELNFPVYIPNLLGRDVGLSSKTLCMQSQQFLADGTPVRHYDVHNLYGWSQTKPTLDALQSATGERGIIIPRSTYPSSGKWAGHWLGDNFSRWDQLLKSIIGMMEFSLFGISYTGADICGFNEHTNYQMCARWMQLGAFYPFARNHNGIGYVRQDPVSFDRAFEDLSRNVLNTRYTLLPYLYTLLYEAHDHGSTVVRPLLHEFTDDRTTWDIDRQFLWGPALLISPVLDENQTTVNAYFPDARWYDYYTSKDIGVRGNYSVLQAELEHINLHLRGGYIIPWQLPDLNTNASRKQPMGLTVALDDNGAAQGLLYWDDGKTIGKFGKLPSTEVLIFAWLMPSTGLKKETPKL
uniref:Maltase n=1 Tax=Podarcis muralis TaxID=64176 RepID=A0A670IDX3_PODMU